MALPGSCVYSSYITWVPRERKQPPAMAHPLPQDDTTCPNKPWELLSDLFQETEKDTFKANSLSLMSCIKMEGKALGPHGGESWQEIPLRWFSEREGAGFHNPFLSQWLPGFLGGPWSLDPYLP